MVSNSVYRSERLESGVNGGDRRTLNASKAPQGRPEGMNLWSIRGVEMGDSGHEVVNDGPMHQQTTATSRAMRWVVEDMSASRWVVEWERIRREGGS